jgi:hypothetical protein
MDVIGQTCASAMSMLTDVPSDSAPCRSRQEPVAEIARSTHLCRTESRHA